jgi:O-antigen/teichoic acid export membrane protein
MTKNKFNQVVGKLLKSEFNRNVLTLMTGTTIAQAIPIAITPILTRIYTPEDFGVFALFMAIASIFGTIVNGRYELAIMLPQKDEDAINIFALGFIIAFVISLILLILVLVFNNYFVNLLGNKEIGVWLFFIPITVFLVGLWKLLNCFNIRKKQYKDIAKATIIKTIVLSTVQLSIGLIKSGVTGLISGQIISQLFANTKLLSNIIKDKVLISKISKVKIISLAKKYQDFPKHNAPAALSDSAALELPSILLPKLFGMAMSGYFFLAHKMIAIPSALIGKSIEGVFFQEMSAKKNMRFKCWPFFIKTVKHLFFIGLPISFFIALFGPYLFQIVFGDQWKVSGEIAPYLAIIFLFTFVVSTVSSVFSVSGYIKRGAFWKHLYLITSLSIFAFSMFVGLKFFEFLFLFTIHEIVLYLIYFYLIAKTVRQMDERII